MPSLLLASVPFALALPALAQTYVVDVNVGPGFDFQQIRGAVAQVPDGATLIVRAGTYAPFTIDGKGLTILAEPGVTVSFNGFAFHTEVRNTSPTQRTVLRGLTLSRQLVLQDCDGPVLLEDVTMQPGFAGTASTAQVVAFRCEQLFARGLRNGGTTTLVYSTAVLEDCTLHGVDAAVQFGELRPGAPGLSVSSSDVTLVGCDLAGGRGLVTAANQVLAASPALSASGGQFRLLGSTVATAGAANGAPTVPALGTPYTPVPVMPVLLDPQVQLATAHPQTADPEFQLTVRPLPHVTGQSAGVGAALTAAAHGPVGQFVILVVGLPGAPLVLPGIENAFWLEPAISAWAAVGVPQAGVPLAASATIPNDPSFRGLCVGWQSLTAGPTGLEASNPAWTLVQ